MAAQHDKPRYSVVAPRPVLLPTYLLADTSGDDANVAVGRELVVLVAGDDRAGEKGARVLQVHHLRDGGGVK